MMMMIVNLYSTVRKTPLQRYVFWCVVKRNVFSADMKTQELIDGSRRWSGKWFQVLGPVKKKARRPNMLQ